MYRYALFISLFFISCFNKKEDDFVPARLVPGEWLILGEQHILKSNRQREIYGRKQDSIINLMGLKLISFKKDGTFFQMDSLFGDHGNWMIIDSANLQIASAGTGFENFNGKVAGILNDTLLISEIVSLEGEQIKLIWYLKKILPGNDAANLFKNESNLWRKKPPKKETDEELKKRVVSMLNYYSLYYKLVSEESIYFSRSRVFLPFTYYQHGVGLIPLTPGDDFTNYFFDSEDAEKGYEIISAAFKKTKNQKFPSGKNFVIEYSMYFDGLAKAIE